MEYQGKPTFTVGQLVVLTPEACTAWMVSNSLSGTAAVWHQVNNTWLCIISVFW